jgi:hypothetical protein
MADQDTDRWIFEVLAPDLRKKMKDFKAQGGFEWTDLVAQSLREAHARGITKEQIIHALQIMPFVCGLPQVGILHFLTPPKKTPSIQRSFELSKSSRKRAKPHSYAYPVPTASSSLPSWNQKDWKPCFKK